MLTSDYTERTTALDAGCSFIVEAPAGSGKTSLLMQRYLVLLARAKKAPEEILAITFTRKAAAEMRTRVVAALTYAKNSPPPTEPHQLKIWQLARAALKRDQELNWQILTNPNRLRIYTIDAFCYSLTQQMPLTAGFGAAANIVEQQTTERCYHLAVENLLLSLEDNPPYAAALADLLLHLDNDYQKIERLLISMLRKRDQWLPHIMGNS
ncbi:MAG: UvrD-helicase domain-containing protein, partial [Gammaproteobacteria bacterium]|nr:UvrD-helicase domain-containing protein [Gammaproteobacteria bacterium]